MTTELGKEVHIEKLTSVKVIKEVLVMSSRQNHEKLKLPECL